MLVLTRKLNESIVINDSITIRVVAAGRNRVKLAFEAPPHVRIQRAELVATTSAPVMPETVALPSLSTPPAVTPC